MSNKTLLDWQGNFGKAFTKELSLVIQHDVFDEQSAFTAFNALNLADKKQFWSKMGQRLEITPKTAHDYYHNTWSRRYCDDFQPYKEQVTQIIRQLDQAIPKKEQFKQMYSTLERMYPHVTFHYQTVYQFFNYWNKKINNCMVERSFSNMSNSSYLSRENSYSDINIQPRSTHVKMSKLQKGNTNDQDYSDILCRQADDPLFGNQSLNRTMDDLFPKQELQDDGHDDFKLFDIL